MYEIEIPGLENGMDSEFLVLEAVDDVSTEAVSEGENSVAQSEEAENSEKTEESSEYMAFFKSGYENIPENATLMERLAYGGKVTLIGMVTVFLVLILIWAICALMGKIFGSVASKEKGDSEKKSEQKAPEASSVQATSGGNVSSPVVCSVDNTTITVVASAAIAAYRGEDTVNFTVSSIRPCVSGAVALAPEVVAQIAASIAFLEGKDTVDFTISSIRIV